TARRMVADAPFGMSPSLQTTVAPVRHTPVDGVTEMTRAPAGAGSVTVTSAAACGPRLVTTTPYVTVCPATATSASADFTRLRSARLTGYTGVFEMLFSGVSSG